MSSFLLAFIVLPAFLPLSMVKAAFTCLGGGDHEGAAWNPATECAGGLIAGVHTNIGVLTISSGQTATVQAYNGSTYGTVDIAAASVSIQGTLTAAAKGYTGGSTGHPNGYGPGGGTGQCADVDAGGGGYGGKGSNGASYNIQPGGTVYGSMTAPVDMGSGGGHGVFNSCPGGEGGQGGGAIKITSASSFALSGSIIADGSYRLGVRGGGGSGGSVYVTTSSLTGSGAITANGGGAQYGGGGGGGRIAVYYSASSYSGAITANVGTNGSGGENGTVYIKETSTNDLYIKNSQSWTASPSLEGSVHTFRNVYVQNNSTLTLKGYYTTESDGVGFVFNTSNFTVDSGSKVSADGGGYFGGGYINGHPVGYGAGGGIGLCGDGDAGGGGYGGKGNSGTAYNIQSGGSVYGSMTTPVDLGSGGGHGSVGGCPGGTGGAGGGAIRITASGTLTLSGTISANGAFRAAGRGGGGSGGSILISTATLAGGGTITANGGGSGSGGGGGGGRIALYYSSNTYTGGMSASFAGPGGGGGNGTVYVLDTINNDLYIKNTQTWNANPSLEGALHSYRNITVQNNSTLTLNGYFTTETDGIGFTFNADNFTIDTGSKVSSDGGGYRGGGYTNGHPVGYGLGGGTGICGDADAGGGGYGGKGNYGSSHIPQQGGSTYGSMTAPLDLGSGGGHGWVGGCPIGPGGAGGGAIRIQTSGAITISGSLTSNGSSYTAGRGGGGSGGSIYVVTTALNGGGTITANGGAGGSGGGGGGGRIAVYYTSSTYTGTYAATVASPGAGGENGTVYIKDSLNNDLYIKTSQSWNADPALEGRNHSFRNVYIQNNSTLTIRGYYTNETNGYGITFNTTNFTIETGSRISGDRLGYAGGSTVGHPSGYGPGKGTGICTDGDAGGGGYGGTGGNGSYNGQTGGITYGSATIPTDLGSGGGNGGGGGCPGGTGGSGAGAVKIIANNALTLNGTVSMNGAPNIGSRGGGGSGGSIYLIAGSITGSGTLQALGGNTGLAGTGGGGRIAIYYNTTMNWTGASLLDTVATAGGTGGSGGGQKGTVVINAVPAIGFDLTGSTGLESISPVSIGVTMSSIYAHAVTVDYEVTGTATGNGTDYTLINGTATIPSGQTSTAVPLVINDNFSPEPYETVVVTLKNSSAPILSNAVYTYTIQDDDYTVVSVTGSGITGNASNPDTALTPTINFTTPDNLTIAGNTIELTLNGMTVATGQTLSSSDLTLDSSPISGDWTVSITNGNSGNQNPVILITLGGSSPSLFKGSHGLSIAAGKVRSHATPGNYQIKLLTSINNGSSLYYVGRENEVLVKGVVQGSVSFALRDSGDTSDLGNTGGGVIGPSVCLLSPNPMNTITVSSCSYRLKVATNASSGTVLSYQANGGLSNGSYTLSDAPGTVISTNGVEGYGVMLIEGSTTNGTITRGGAFGGNATYTYPLSSTSPVQMVSSSGQNNPANTDLSNTILITHKASVSAETPSGSYNQQITYLLTPQF